MNPVEKCIEIIKNNIEVTLDCKEGEGCRVDQ